jgi:subtilisin family serine protease
MIRGVRRVPRLVAALLALLVIGAALPLPAGRAAAQEPLPRFVPGEVLIGWTPGRGPVQPVPPSADALRPDTTQPDWQAATAQLAQATRRPVLEARHDQGFARLKVGAGREAAEIARLAALPWVRYAEPNYIAYAADTGPGNAYYPNDPGYPLQWHMQRVGAPEAWAATRGSLSFVVAVLDTGVARNHPEFVGKLLPGKNYVEKLTVLPPEDDDPESHGTHVAGIIAAGLDNGQGVAGLAPDVKILPLKVLDSSRSGSYSDIRQAVIDAANSQAQVINMSLVGYDYSATLQDAIDYAVWRGRLVVAAAGNCPSGFTCDSNYPAAYPAAFPGVLAVGASSRFDQPAPYAIPKPYVGIAAPGGTAERGVWSATRGGYGYMAGTSMAAPMVSAAAALVWTFRPAATPDDIAALLKSTADKVGTHPATGQPLSYAGGRNDYFGYGRLNVGRAVRQVYPPSLLPPPEQRFLLDETRTVQTRAIQAGNPSYQGVLWQADVVYGAEWLSASPRSGASAYGAPGEITLRADAGALTPGVYFGLVRLTPLSPAGLTHVDVPAQLTVAARLSRSFLPLAGNNFASAWLDPDDPNALNRLELNLANDTGAQLILPFPVRFYGADHQFIQVSENGLATFGPGGAPLQPPVFCPGNGAAPNNALYVFAADWIDDGAGRVVVHQPNADTFVVTWQDVRLSGADARATFQLTLGRDGDFRAHYRSLPDPRAGIIGSENDDGTLAEQLLCQGIGRAAPLGGAIVFAPQAPWE